MLHQKGHTAQVTPHVKRNIQLHNSFTMYMASPWTFAVHELSTKATTHSGAALTSKGSERRVMPVQCQNIPATICTSSGTVLGCREAVVRALPSVSLELAEESFFLFDCGEWEAACDASSPLDTPGCYESKDNHCSVMILLRTTIRYVTVSAHFHRGFVLQRGSASNLQMGYSISTGRPRLKHNHRQEGIPPSWSADPSVCARPITSCYGLRSFKKGKCIRLAEVGVQFSTFTCLWSRDRMMCDGVLRRAQNDG